MLLRRAYSVLVGVWGTRNHDWTKVDIRLGFGFEEHILDGVLAFGVRARMIWTNGFGIFLGVTEKIMFHYYYLIIYFSLQVSRHFEQGWLPFPFFPKSKLPYSRSKYIELLFHF